MNQFRFAEGLVYLILLNLFLILVDQTLQFHVAETKIGFAVAVLAYSLHYP